MIWEESKQHGIITLDKEKFQPRQVLTDMEDDTHIQIVSGLNKGEKVVTSAQFLLDSEISLKSALQRLNSSLVSQEESPGV
ncbi:MAG: hypothetical protein K2X53_00060 [Alphaproteobacteria bacterium]|nr:hypothetical protein [Alphaproteobacteria bacterium]